MRKYGGQAAVGGNARAMENGFYRLNRFSPSQVCLLQTCYKWHSCGAGRYGRKVNLGRIGGAGGSTLRSNGGESRNPEKPVGKCVCALIFTIYIENK